MISFDIDGDDFTTTGSAGVKYLVFQGSIDNLAAILLG